MAKKEKDPAPEVELSDVPVTVQAVVDGLRAGIVPLFEAEVDRLRPWARELLEKKAHELADRIAVAALEGRAEDVERLEAAAALMVDEVQVRLDAAQARAVKAGVRAAIRTAFATVVRLVPPPAA